MLLHQIDNHLFQSADNPGGAIEVDPVGRVGRLVIVGVAEIRLFPYATETGVRAA